MNTSALLNIPTFPPVATKLLQLAANDETGAADLVHLLRSDPALAAQIIRHANSPLYGLVAEITALDHAVALIGVRKIRMLALAVISRTYISALAMEDSLRAFWRHSLASALLAERIASRVRVQEDTAYGAALLHDIGRLGLMVAHPQEYPKLLETAAADLAAGTQLDLLERERALFDIDRFEAGEWLARTWNLPQDFREAAGRYDVRAREHIFDLIGVVLWSGRIANSLGYAMLGNPNKPSYDQILQGLPSSLAAYLPTSAEILAARIEKEIAALDSNGAVEEESANTALVTLVGDYPGIEQEDGQIDYDERQHAAERVKRRKNLRLVLLIGCVALLIGAVLLKLATGH